MDTEEFAKSSKKGHFRIGRILRHAVEVVAVLVILPVFFLLVFEGGLRVAGFGHSTRPLIKRNSDSGAFYSPNPAFYQQFFSLPVSLISDWDDFDFQMPAKKDEKTCRIFVFGSSAAVGQPPDGAYSFWRILDAMLASRFPGVRFETYCMAFPMSNSHVMRAAAKACAKFQPDLFVVYMGNNEITGPFGAGSRITDSPSWNLSYIHANTFLTDLRLVQLASGRGGKFAITAKDLDLFFPSLPPDSPKIARTFEFYERNLQDICDAGIGAGASVVLSSVGANLRDYAPDAAENRLNISPGDKEKWGGIFESGKTAEQTGAWGDALSKYAEAASIDDTHAGLRFHMGTCCWNLGDYENARKHFEVARDMDFHRSRSGAQINSIVAKVATANEKRGVFFADAVKRLSDASPHGISGSELFYDNVHMTFDGNYETAAAVFEQVVKALPERVRKVGVENPAVLDKEECAQRLAFTPWMRQRHLDAAVSSISTFMIGFPNEEHKRNLEWWKSRSDELKASLGPDARAAAGNALRKALAMNEADSFLYSRLLLLHDLGENSIDALATAKTFSEKFPQRCNALRAYGVALTAANRFDEAIQQFQRCLRLYPENASCHEQLGAAFSRKQNYGDAVNEFRFALRLNPDDEFAENGLVESLINSGNPTEALASIDAAMKAHPEKKNLRVSLIKALIATGNGAKAKDEADKCRSEGVFIPPDVEALLNKIGAIPKK